MTIHDLYDSGLDSSSPIQKQIQAAQDARKFSEVGVWIWNPVLNEFKLYPQWLYRAMPHHFEHVTAPYGIREVADHRGRLKLGVYDFA